MERFGIRAAKRQKTSHFFKDFSLKQLGIEYDILDIGSHSDIQHTVLTDINDDEIEEFIDECAGADNWEEEWDFVDSDYFINRYELL